MHLFKQVCQRILLLSESLVTFMTSHGNQIWPIRYFTRAHCMINKDSFYGVMTNHYEVNVFYFLCYSAELDSKHNVAGFRLLSLLCVTLTCTFTGNSIQTIAHFCAFSLGYVEMCINPLSPLSRHKFSIPIFIQLFKDIVERIL